MPFKPDLFHITMALLLAFLALLGIRLLRLVLKRGGNREAKGTDELFMGVLRDRTEGALQAKADLVASEQALEELKILHSNLIQHLPLGVIVFSAAGSLYYVNPLAMEWLGEPAPGQTFAEWCPDLNSHFLKQEGVSEASTSRLRLVLGDVTRDMSISYAQLPDARWMLILQDQSDLVQLEEQLGLKRDLALMGELASGIAHEVKNALALIQGHLQMLVLGDGEDHVAAIQNEIRRLLMTVREFMNSSRDDQPERVCLNLRDVFQAVGEHWQHHPWESKLQIDAPPPGLRLFSDESQVTTLVNNLILNGMEACQAQSPPQKWVKLWAEDRDGGIVVAVSDQGPGFSKDALAKRFVPFVSSKEGGSGFGLFHCRRIMLQHGGTIEIHNGPPTTITCFFPNQK